MNIVALSNRLASKVPHWHELEKLSKEDKIEVIALLSMSMANAEEIKTPADRTKEWQNVAVAHGLANSRQKILQQISTKVKCQSQNLSSLLVEDADIIIGTTAIINNMVMVTENVKHIGRLNGIVVENWMEK